jgi:hypothetical protein
MLAESVAEENVVTEYISGFAGSCVCCIPLYYGLFIPPQALQDMPHNTVW